MGKEQSKLAQEGYVISTETKNHIIATKEDEAYFIKTIHLTQLPRQGLAVLLSEIEILNQTNHPHLVNIRNSFKDEKQDILYVIMTHCQAGSIADKIEKIPPESFQESEILSWFVEICMALKFIHEACLVHKDLIPKSILFTECGLVRLGGFGNIHESSKSQSATDSDPAINYLPPEVFTRDTYDAKSNIWSLGCILYELCVQKQAFSAETTIKLMPKIISGTYPPLPSHFSFDLCDLLNDLLKKEPEERPTASEILVRPVIIRCLRNKCQTTVEDLQMKVEKLRALADGLERVHTGTTVGSLTGGVIGAVGGITSIVGLFLAPFTLGTSLIVTGVGVGVGALGGVTAGASNITNMVNQSSERKAVCCIIKDLEERINAVVSWLLEINSGLQTIQSHCPQTASNDSKFTEENLKRVGFKAGKGLGGMVELFRLVQVTNIGKLAAQTSRAVRVAEVATGVLSALFVAVDIFFIAMDAKEIHHIREAKEAESRNELPSAPESETGDTISSSDQATLLSNSLMQESDNAEVDLYLGALEASTPPAESKSEIMKFVYSIRQAAHNLEKILGELATIISSIPCFQEETELEWQNMELM